MTIDCHHGKPKSMYTEVQKCRWNSNYMHTFDVASLDCIGIGDPTLHVHIHLGYIFRHGEKNQIKLDQQKWTSMMKVSNLCSICMTVVKPPPRDLPRTTATWWVSQLEKTVSGQI